jgi:mannose-6-phosphate isomerase-like protein (cupin superfamily)
MHVSQYSVARQLLHRFAAPQLLQNSALDPETKSMLPRDKTTGDHYTWGGVCDGWHLLKAPGLSVIQERVPPGASEVKHFHTHAHQFFFVLSGTATLEFADESVSFGAHQGVHVPAGLEHRFVNNGSDPVEFLVISSPPTAGDRTNVGSSA